VWAKNEYAEEQDRGSYATQTDHSEVGSKDGDHVTSYVFPVCSMPPLGISVMLPEHGRWAPLFHPIRVRLFTVVDGHVLDVFQKSQRPVTGFRVCGS